jgi:hypothetical protein
MFCFFLFSLLLFAFAFVLLFFFFSRYDQQDTNTQTHAEIYHTKIARENSMQVHAVFTFKPIFDLSLVYFWQCEDSKLDM